jgi:hypothetical protein
MDDDINDNNDINNITNVIKDDEIIYIYTKKITAIKTLVEALKEIFRDVSVKFMPKIVRPLETDPTE